jgi:transcriptional regulator with XRE-family HTH domain
MNGKNVDQPKGWLQANLQDPEFQRLYAREELIEDFLGAVEEAMQQQGVSRSDLANRLGCKPANITQIMRRTRNLTASTMVDIAFALGLRLQLQVEPAQSEDGQQESGGPPCEAGTPCLPSSKVVPLLTYWQLARRTRFTETPASKVSGGKAALAS